MKAIERLHAGYVHGRRVEVLQDALAGLIPTGASVLDVGTGGRRLLLRDDPTCACLVSIRLSVKTPV